MHQNHQEKQSVKNLNLLGDYHLKKQETFTRFQEIEVEKAPW